MVYWTGYCDCVHHALKCVPESLRTYIYFTRIQEEKYFCCNKIFTSRKLTGDEILFLFFPFSIKWHHKHMYFEQRTQRSLQALHFTSQQTHTHIYVFFLKFLLEFLKNFPSPLTEVAGRNFPMRRCCLIAKLHSLLFQTTIMNIHLTILGHKSINTHMLMSCTI